MPQLSEQRIGEASRDGQRRRRPIDGSSDAELHRHDFERPQVFSRFDRHGDRVCDRHESPSMFAVNGVRQEILEDAAAR